MKHLAPAVLLAASLAASAEDWPAFRGRNGSGISSSKVPAEFSAESKVLWRAKLGDGVGAPVIVSGRVFSSAMTGDETCAVFCHDAAKGTQLWKRELPTGVLPRITPPNSHASSTPAADAERVYFYFSTLGLIALDASTGAEVWRHELPKPAFLMDWGAAYSPIVHDGLVIFCQDDDLSPFVIAVDAKTGRQR